MAMIQLRKVPDDIDHTITRRARNQGIPKTEYVMRLLRKDAARPTTDEWLEMRAASPSRTVLGDLDIGDLLQDTRPLDQT